MIKKIDLHTHTNASDGIYSPEELIDYAISQGIGAMAITDHDTVSGLPEAMKYAKRIGFELIPGIEFSIEYSGGSLHLVGLYIDYNNALLIEKAEWLKEHRMTRAVRIIEDLRKYNIDIPLKRLEKETKGGAIGKPHIARIMIEMKYGKDTKEIFKNFMCKGKPGYIEKDRISLEEAIFVIKQSRGIPVVAHPISMNLKIFDRYEKKVDEMIQLGIEGLEVYSSMHTEDDVSEFLKIAQKRNLLVTGGSDFHGDKSKVIGAYIPDKNIPVEILYKVKEYRDKTR